MTMSTFMTSPASPDELPSIAVLQHQACMSDPGFSAIFPGPPTSASLAHLTRQYEEMMKSDSSAHVMVAKETECGDIVSYAIWHFVPSNPAEAVEEEMLADVDRSAFPPTANSELGQKLVKNSIRKRIEIVSEGFGIGKPYAYLGAIGTNPQHQKRGAASKLMKWGIDRADSLLFPIYIESTPVGISLSQRFGFQEHARLILDLEPHVQGEFANICMIRFPNAT